ncbi:hypothetical protein OZ664_05420 [Elizabethkingia sp. HX WHF]|uniref:hypothetical protein n=1 Tax=Elizabethkingia sp. HX WHF TaxID=3003190 RepID=UPI002A244DD2|nr:hypothetical protein [Elizabethkingia sp. HX WHF]MDX8563434.1 hypothetical protein [Elizabethkingia sp. HX WHF]
MQKRKLNKRIQKRVEELVSEYNSKPINSVYETYINNQKIKINLNDIDIDKSNKLIKDLDDKIERQKEITRKWQIEFNKVTDIMKLAKETEKNDLYKSISLYESVLNSKYGNFSPEERLVILYHKVGYYEDEIKISELIISKIKKSNSKRLINALKGDPVKESEIRIAWANFTSYIGSDGRQKTCSTDYSKYEKRINKAYQLIKQNKI